MSSTVAVLTSTLQERWRANRHAAEVHHLALLVKRCPTPCNDPPCKLRAGLFIGSIESEASLAALQAAGITHILQAGAELAPSHPEQFIYKRLSVSDEEDEDLVAVLKEASEFIDEGRKSGAVLVHCAQGISRSAAVLTAYLMTHARFSFQTALSHVQQARPNADPNQGFRLQLQEFERLGCCCESWAGWDKQRFERCFKSSSVSGRRAVSGMADLIRRFHMHDVCDDDTVFCDSTVIL
ncbi:protein-tyrosine phosphatase-like protein [Scenedesmus sp. NREL 46B-D3]|nr:protein-tyrosine phosphatase-like protein [Scenedesmus sp. NREL 46B-D3]